MMGKSKWADLIQGSFSCMSKGGVPQIMAQRDCLCQIFVEAQSLCNGPGVLGHFQGMGQSGSVMVSFWQQKYLRLLLKSAECLAVKDPVPVSLKYRPDIAFFLRLFPASGMDAEHRIGA